MSFEAYGVQSDSKKSKSNVDWDAMNKYVVEAAGLQEPETLSGVVSVLVDLGTQKQPDGQYELDKEDKDLTIEQLTEKYAADIADKGIYFKEGYSNNTKQILKHVPQKDRQSVAFAVDFPDIVIDKGQFFKKEDGSFESNPKPLRLWMGGQFWNGEAMVVQNMIPLKVIKDDKLGWTMNPKSTPYKMAVASKLIKPDSPFSPDKIDGLVGKTLQFQARVFFKEGNNGKKYYTEQIKFVGGLPRGGKDQSVENTYVIQFNQENDPKALKELRGHIVNTIKNATNFEGSQIEAQLNEIYQGGDEEKSKDQKTPDVTVDDEDLF